MPKCFVISPRLDIFEKIFNHVIKPAMQECDIEIFRPLRPTNEAFNSIPTHDFCILVLSLKHPFLFYELAIAQFSGLSIIFLKRKDESLPFDLQEEFYITYSLKDLIGSKVEKVIKQLVDKVKHLKEKNWEGSQSQSKFSFVKNKYYKDKRSHKTEKNCLIISALGEQESSTRNHISNVIDYIIKPALQECNIKPYSIILSPLDSIFTDRTPLKPGLLKTKATRPGLISQAIYEAILTVDFCIAILTFLSPSVFYELGIAHCESRPVIKLMWKEKYEGLPFDLRENNPFDFTLYDMRILSKEYALYGDVFKDDLKDSIYCNQIIDFIRNLKIAEWKASNFPFRDTVIKNEFHKFVKKKILPMYREITFDRLSYKTGLESHKIEDFIEKMISKGEIDAEFHGRSIVFTTPRSISIKDSVKKKVKKSLDLRHDVFICHSSKDKEFADATCHFLEQNGIKCWIAPRDVSTGSYAASIVNAIETSKLLVMIFSNNSNVSDHVKNELEIAVSSGITIQPFRIENVEPSTDMKYYIKRMHWLDALTPPLEDHLSKLTEKISQLLEAILT